MPFGAVSRDSEAAGALGAGGAFASFLPGFTPRESQQEMARRVEQTLRDGGVLVAESGTGTGKTFAYLAPVLLTGARTIVSTGTRHLQDQLFNRDLPTVAKALGVSVNSALLKGRANYLCRHRLRDFDAPQTVSSQRLSERERRLLEEWAATTVDGDIAGVAGIPEESPIWQGVTSTADNCLGSQCPEFEKCYVVRARRRAMQADVVVVNHHLFFSDLTLKQEGFSELLPGHDAVIMDEAHQLPDVASAFFGYSVSTAQIAELCRDVPAAEAADKSGSVFTAALDALLAAANAMRSEFTEPARGDAEGLFSARRSREGVESLQASLEELAELLAAAAPAGEELARCHERCLSLQGRLSDWVDGGDLRMIRWYEASARNVRFHGTPLQVGDLFSAVVERGDTAWLFTSATLAVERDFSHFCDTLGLSALSDIETAQWGSPYDFAGNSLLYLPPALPDPRQPGYAEALVAAIKPVLEASRGRAFVLFTSHAMLQRVEQMLRPGFGWPLLAQGEAPRSELLLRFVTEPNAVLLGTASFWEGVDVKGEALACVIIDKLPFAHPGDPVLRARLAAVEEEGESPFMRVQLPEAVMALKQGAGRLIRSETDRGVLMLCDPRLLAKRYGKVFLKSLPPMPLTRALRDVEQFYAQ